MGIREKNKLESKVQPIWVPMFVWSTIL